MIYENLATKSMVTGNKYYVHYATYLQSIAFQMFKWENLPPGVNERFLEMSLHLLGRVAIVKHPELNIIAAQGSPYGTLDIYGLPNQFQCVFPNQRQNYKGTVYNYGDDLKETCDTVVIINNDFERPTTPSLLLFSEDLAHIKMVKKVNINNQKTPFILTTNQKQLMSLKKLQQQMDNYQETIFVDEKLDPNQVFSVPTVAPYVADKLNEELTYTWNEIVTYLGLKNANNLKKERMIVDEVNANNEQTDASENIYLKTREEAARKMNELWGLNVKVSIRTEIVDELLDKKEGELDG